jgi:hypothetical protein
VNLEPAQVPDLPLATALFDRDGRLMAASPEWPGPAPGSAGYASGFGHLVVASEGVPPALDALLGRLLEELSAAAAPMPPAAARRLAVLQAGLELVSGRPPGHIAAEAIEVLELVKAVLPARAPGLDLDVEAAPPWPRVDSPGAIALAVVQLAVNAQRHEDARRVALRLAPGPTFYVEWPAHMPAGAAVDSHRHLSRRLRWGWGYVQMVADFLGGVALPPGPTGPGREGAALSLGSTRLGLPLASARRGRLEGSTMAWSQDRTLPAPGSELDEPLIELVAEAEGRIGKIVYRDLLRARSRGPGRTTWLALPPETGSSRARDVLRGLEHERVLWTVPDAQAIRIQSLATLLAVRLGDPWPSVPPSVWDDVFPPACRALDVPAAQAPTSLFLPDPRLAAFLLAELGGELVAIEQRPCLLLVGEPRDQVLWDVLGAATDGVIRLG